MNGRYFHSRLLSSLCAALVVAATPCVAAEQQWIQLFNGRDLSGWVQHGGKARYEVADGMILGHSVLNTDNSFLCTKEVYSDFVLELEFKVDPDLNSGVQVRSQCFEKATKLEDGGKTISIPAGRVHGYQVEIDMDPANKRWWTAGIYDEARRGWLYPGTLGGEKTKFTEQGARLGKQGEWNRMRVEARGDSIKTWLNDELRADLRDSLTRRGFIALQVHGVGGDKSKENLTVAFRNIRLRPFSEP